VSGNSFEIWERQQRAVHAVGRISPRRGGSRIELAPLSYRAGPERSSLCSSLSYVIVAFGHRAQPPEPDVSAAELAIAFLGGAALGGHLRDQRASAGARHCGAFVDRALL